MSFHSFRNVRHYVITWRECHGTLYQGSVIIQDEEFEILLPNGAGQKHVAAFTAEDAVFQFQLAGGNCSCSFLFVNMIPGQQHPLRKVIDIQPFDFEYEVRKKGLTIK